jgi:hypothetical protein
VWILIAAFRTNVMVVAALAACIGLAELREITYKRTVLPLFPLAKH